MQFDGNAALSESDINLKLVHIKPTNPSVNYEQIDTIRFVTIFFIIWGHSLLGWNERITHSFTEEWVKIFVIQTGKISTIIFFIVSGFLLNSRINKYTLFSYFKERTPKIYAPWIAIIIIFMVISIVQLIPLKDLWETRDIKGFIKSNYAILNGLLLYSAYWFITTYIIGMALIISLKKHINKPWLGLVLFSLTAFYCLNLHYMWIAANHAKAVLSYTFFIWLGIQINNYHSYISDVLKRISWPFVLLALFGSFILASYEGYWLTIKNCGDAFASNRFSNGILSILLFFAMLKFGKVSRINKLNPRKTVYGIYLLHPLLIFEIMIVINFYFKDYLSTVNVWKGLVLQIIFTTFIMILTYKLVKIIGNSRIKGIIGLS